MIRNVIPRNTMIVLVMIHAIIPNIFAQDRDKTLFEEIYLRELSDSNATVANTRQFSKGVAYLPSWFCQLPQASNQIKYAIGISDPEIKDSVLARKQAFLRALFQLSLMEGATISGISDLYNENLKTKYEEYNKLNSEVTFHGQCHIADSTITQFNEKILLIKFEPDLIQSLTINSQAEYYTTRTKTEIGWVGSEHSNYKLYTTTDSLKFECLINNTVCETTSILNKDTIVKTTERYEYTISTNNATTTLKQFTKGLWVGYLQAWLNGLLIAVSNNKSKIKELTSLQRPSNGETNHISLSRVITKNKITSYIENIDTKNNELNINFRVIVE